jgi:hypothetical protein
MDGKEIMNSFKKETFYEFSEAVPVFDDNIYFIFKVDIISIDMNPSRTKMDKLKKAMKNKTCENSISHLDIEPIAYILETKSNAELDYQIESIDEKHNPFIEKNKNQLLKEFFEREKRLKIKN